MNDRPPDPVLARRARIARLCELGQRVGYVLFGLFMALIVLGGIIGFSDLVATAATVALVVGSLVLAPAIVFSYAVKAADREDRERGVGGPGR
ncbi:MAG: hypothetical protein MUF83_22540 [Acidimicrobiales bacterium]|nr:hypothetical protein [Acidimicrobiales bacterium]